MYKQLLSVNCFNVNPLCNYASSVFLVKKCTILSIIDEDNEDSLVWSAGFSGFGYF